MYTDTLLTYTHSLTHSLSHIYLQTYIYLEYVLFFIIFEPNMYLHPQTASYPSQPLALPFGSKPAQPRISY